PKWAGTLLAGAVCMLVPAVGPIVFLGYLVEVTEGLLRDPRRQDYPAFDTARLTDYLLRGLWPFLEALPASLPLGLRVGLLVGAVIAVAAVADQPLLLIGIPVVAIPLGLLLSVLVWPFTLHAGLRGQFDFGGSLRFARRFLGLVGGKALLAAVVNGLAGLVLLLVGYLLTLLCGYLTHTHAQ